MKKNGLELSSSKRCNHMVSPPCWKRVKIVHRGRRPPPNDNMLSVKQLCTRSKALTVALGDDQATADPLAAGNTSRRPL